MIRIIVVEDNDVVREGVVELLNDQPDMQVVGEAEDGLRALELLDQERNPDLVLTDLNMDRMDGIMLAKQLHEIHPHIKVIILTMHLRADFIERAFEAGVKGYVLKSGNIEDVYEGIRRVWAGEEFVTSGF